MRNDKRYYQICVVRKLTFKKRNVDTYRTDYIKFSGKAFKHKPKQKHFQFSWRKPGCFIGILINILSIILVETLLPFGKTSENPRLNLAGPWAKECSGAPCDDVPLGLAKPCQDAPCLPWHVWFIIGLIQEASGSSCWGQKFRENPPFPHISPKFNS